MFFIKGNRVHWGAAESPYLEIFKGCLDMVLGNLFGVTLPEQRWPPRALTSSTQWFRNDMASFQGHADNIHCYPPTPLQNIKWRIMKMNTQCRLYHVSEVKSGKLLKNNLCTQVMGYNSISTAVVHTPQTSHMVQDICHFNARMQFLKIKPAPFIDSSYLLKIKTHHHEITDRYLFEIGWGLEHFKILSLWLKLVSTGTLSLLHGTITLQYLNPCSYTRITSSSLWSLLFQNKDGVSFFFLF